MFESDKSTKAIVKLIRETTEGNVEWSTTYEHLSLPIEGEVVDSAYEANYKNRKFRIYKCKYKAGGLSAAINVVPFWDFKIRLDLVDGVSNKALWTFENNHALEDLYETVKYKTSNVDKILDDILKED